MGIRQVPLWVKQHGDHEACHKHKVRAQDATDRFRQPHEATYDPDGGKHRMKGYGPKLGRTRFCSTYNF